MYLVRGGLSLYCFAVMVFSILVLRSASFPRSNARLSLQSLRSQGLSSGLPLAMQRSTHVGRAVFLTRGMSWRQKKDDFIDVDTGISFRDDNKSKKKKDEDKPGDGLLSSIGSGLAKMFGVDEKSQEKKRQRKAVNTAIDTMLKGTGVAGTLVGGVMKAAAGMLSDAFAESASDMQSVYSLITDALDGDEEVSGLLGRDIRVDSTFSSSSSSMSVKVCKAEQSISRFKCRGRETRPSSRRLPPTVATASSLRNSQCSCATDASSTWCAAVEVEEGRAGRTTVLAGARSSTSAAPFCRGYSE